MYIPASPDGVLCDLALGVSTGFIGSSQITASSSLNVVHDTSSARLLRGTSASYSWVSRQLNDQQYVQVNLLNVTRVTGVATQGRATANHWVTSYKILCSQDAKTWITYQEDGQDKVFLGNYDRDSVVRNSLSSPLSCRYVRINPQTWVTRIALRFEFFGCQDGKPDFMVSCSSVLMLLQLLVQFATLHS
jgi:hypothetical protein